MFSDEEIKESGFMRPGDEIISIHEIYLNDKYDKKDWGFNSEPLLSSSSRNNLEFSRFLRDGFYPEGLEPSQAKFAWTEEDGNIASLVSEPGFGSTFDKELDSALATQMKEADTSSSVIHKKSNGYVFATKPYVESNDVSSTSGATSEPEANKGKGKCKIDKEDPRSRFHYVKYVKRHGRTVKLWECGICSREFQHQYTLMRHLPTHTDERNYHCVECSKSFRQLSTLSQHRAIHSAERPYSCEVCNKTFNRVSTLISHRKTHYDEKPYKCHICPKGFHQKGNLRNHLFTHTNERPYRCNICKKGFNQQSNLVCHKNKTHPDESNGTPVYKNKVSTQALRPRTGKMKPNPSRSAPEQCEVTSSVGPYIPSENSFKEDLKVSSDIWGTGVIVDQIKTYHMGVAMATRQTPFALLNSDNEAPVLVKVVDTKLPGGKQMLVPATAEDLRTGGKIVLNDDSLSEHNVDPSNESGAVQIRVPIVATVIPKIKAGVLHLTVEEPHHAYHTALSTDAETHQTESCSMLKSHHLSIKTVEQLNNQQLNRENIKPGPSLSYCTLPPPAPSPPLDLIPLDLFEPMEMSMPHMGSSLSSMNTDKSLISEHSDDSDIFICKFEESIPLSDSD
ncbi:zinc finger protein 143-like [Leptidea sinapis]|uniref:zinc finger protein 143-like n=1 Tax=Leptidea sinapis TaxID=189913 RepID=UPI0021403CD2|nr:zinc finger protein 143-like [Leptidea sinapis]